MILTVTVKKQWTPTADSVLQTADAESSIESDVSSELRKINNFGNPSKANWDYAIDKPKQVQSP